MHTLSFTRYVDEPADVVRERLTIAAEAATRDASVEVTAMSDDVSRVVVALPWDGRDETSRRASTLNAARVTSRVFDAAA